MKLSLNTYRPTRIKRSLILLLLMALSYIPSLAQPRLLNAVYPYPSEEQHCLLIDRQGLIWIGSNAGIKSYDGYRFKSYRSNAATPNILPSNNVLCMTEGNDDVLWIGTRNGLVSMDKKTGKFTTHLLPGTNNRIIYSLFTSRDGKIWIGTDGGVTCYLPQEKTFYHYSAKNTAVIESNGKKRTLTETIGAKSFTEDKAGNIYIGTWSKSLYRLDTKRSIMYQYDIPKANDAGNTYMVKMDHKGRLWICTWGNGIKCMTHPLNHKDPGFMDLYHGDKDYYIHYNIVEDTISHTLWACARNGYGIISSDNIEAGFTYHKSIDNHSTINVTDIKTDGRGNIWLLTMNNGLYHVNTQPALFQAVPILPLDAQANRINSIFTVDGEHIWLTLSPIGIAYYDSKSQHTFFNNAIPGASNIPAKSINTHYSDIISNGKGGIWFANNSFGITELQNGNARILDENNCGFVKDRFVNTFYRTQRGIIFVGEKMHLNYQLPSGKSFGLMEDVDVRGITEDHKGNIWVATENQGIIRISGNFNKPSELNIKYYNAANASSSSMMPPTVSKTPSIVCGSYPMVAVFSDMTRKKTCLKM